jgi:[2Fe-2S] binding domain
MPGDGTNEGGEGANIVGPRNAAREKQDPFTVHPPASDHGTMPNLKWSFADSHIRMAVLDEVKSGIPSHVTYDLDADPQLTNSELRERMSGNICRCGACSNIAEAVAEVAGRHA